MKKKTRFIYKKAKYFYSLLPFKKFFCILIKRSKIPNNLFYKYLWFNGIFKVNVSVNKTITMCHYGGGIENEIYWKGLFNSWENETGWIWKQLCKCSVVIFDVGANTGIYSLVAKSINPESSVYAFEPSINTFKKLTLNNSLNKFNICCEQIAISNTNSKQVFFDVPNPNQTSASLSAEMLKNNDWYKGDIFEYEVRTMTLSSYINRKSLDRIDLIKIDIEMHEPEAIEGLGYYLNKFKPVVIIEVLTEEVAIKLNTLIDKNYIIFHLENDGIAKKVSKFSPVKGLWNYLFFHKSLENNIKKHTTLYSGSSKSSYASTQKT